MIWIYRLLFLPALIVALPYYGWRMWRRGGYGKDFSHRFGFFHRLPPPKADRTRIWIQAVSVGEIRAIGPLLEILERRGNPEIVLTTTTSTGYAEARKIYRGKVLAIGVFPLDFVIFSWSAWKRIRPQAVVLTESELWPEHLQQARRNRACTFLINARMSDRSFNRYRVAGNVTRHLMAQIDHIFAATDLDQERLLKLGANPARVTCPGNIKCDVPTPTPLPREARLSLRASLGFTAEPGTSPFVLLGSSTWPGEEAVLLDVQQSLVSAGHDCRLLLVPRHAERRGDIVSLLRNQNLRWHQRSTGPVKQTAVQIYLADTMGELLELTQAADLAFIGKSLPPNIGGQTPIEAAGIGIPLVMGPNMNNFKSIVRSLVHSGAARQVPDARALSYAVTKLHADPSARLHMGEAGRTWHQRNRGSSARIAEAILSDLETIKSSP